MPGQTQTNEAMQVNICTQVNSKAIRRETHNGREHIVIPSYTMPFDVVMNGGLYPRDEIVANYQKLDGTLAPLGHPKVDGKYVSAFSPEGINVGHIGAWNRNTKLVGNRVYTEKWVDVEFAQNTDGGRRLIDRIEQIERGEGEPVHTSVAVHLQREMVANTNGYDWIARIKDIDHDAILLDEPGAATPDQGVGLMVNADQATPLQTNAGALVGESFRERENRLDRAVRARFAANPDDSAWVADFTDSQVVIVRNGGAAEVYAYSSDGGQITIADTATPVVRQESWVSMIANSFKRFFTNQARPEQPKEGDMPLTAEEKAELTNDISKAVTDQLAANMAETLKPLTDKVEALQANHKELADTLTANVRAEEADKRKAVAAKHGEVVANALSGEALDAMYKSLGEAAPLAGGLAPNAADKPKFDEVPE